MRSDADLMFDLLLSGLFLLPAEDTAPPRVTRQSPRPFVLQQFVGLDVREISDHYFALLLGGVRQGEAWVGRGVPSRLRSLTMWKPLPALPL